MKTTKMKDPKPPNQNPRNQPQKVKKQVKRVQSIEEEKKTQILRS